MFRPQLPEGDHIYLVLGFLGGLSITWVVLDSFTTLL